MNLDGTMAESYCRLEESEAVRSCCDLGGAPAGTCGTDRPPQSCDMECVELWLPLVEICGQYLAVYQVGCSCLLAATSFLNRLTPSDLAVSHQGFTEACQSQATHLLARAPSSMSIAGLECHPGANGDFSTGR